VIAGSSLPRTDGSSDCGRQFRIVVADDDLGIRQVLVRLLSDDFDIVGIVSNGRELIDAVRHLKPDVVIVDIAMPELNGLDAVRKMRTDGFDTKVVFLTTNGNPLYVRTAFNLGANGYVLKALGFEELPLALHAVLGGGKFVSPALELIAKGSGRGSRN
jgi:DNA-binding NarL/FixJ family response regulator